MELFKDIKGYEGLYQVSNLGRVKSLKYGKERFLSPRYNKKGYITARLYSNSTSKNHMVHRLVAETFIPNPTHKEQVNHIDGNKQNNKVSNLEWVTNYENCLHAHKNGFIATPNPKHGEETYNHKLTKEDVEYIRTHYMKKDKNNNSIILAKKFNVSSSLILLIIKNQRWKENNYELSTS